MSWTAIPDDLLRRRDDLAKLMRSGGYAESTIYETGRLIQWLAKSAMACGWTTFEDAYSAVAARCDCSSSYKAQLKCNIKTIETFLNTGRVWEEKHDGRVDAKERADRLSDEFKEFLQHYVHEASLRGLAKSTIRNCCSNTRCFLLKMQEQGMSSLNSITEAAILEYFIAPDTRTPACSTIQQVRSVFKSGLSWRKEHCQRVLNMLPSIRKRRKNVQYLTDSEADAIEKVIADQKNVLSPRDRAIGALLAYTPLRASDIASIQLHDIDWDASCLLVTQPKTRQALRLPLTPDIGNPLYDYITKMRPNECSCKKVFVTTRGPVQGISAMVVENTVNKLYSLAGIRTKSGDRRGSHLFRFRAVEKMLNADVPQPVISSTLGHLAPESLSPYLSADLTHLQDCSLSIDRWPVREDVFR